MAGEPVSCTAFLIFDLQEPSAVSRLVCPAQAGSNRPAAAGVGGGVRGSAEVLGLGPRITLHDEYNLIKPNN